MDKPYRRLAGSAAGSQPRVALLVAGVGRSGTSALTRVLSLLGAGLPNTLLGPGFGNERGHWEPKRLAQINEGILNLQGSSWFSTEPIPRAWFSPDQVDQLVDRIARCIAAEYAQAPLLVIKDPRLCRLLPLHLAALDRLGIAARVILPLRHPGEVVHSICARDQCDPRAAELLWVRHVLQAEADSRFVARVWTTYGGLLADWRDTVARIADTLGLVWPRAPEHVAAEIERELEPKLRHFDAGREGLRAGPLAMKLWMTTQTGHEDPLRQAFDEIGLVVSELDRLRGVAAA